MKSTLTGSLFVDARWSGNHGIARYSHEVLRRLSLDHKQLQTGIKPTSPLDAFNPARWRFSSHDIIYSPGFNAGITSAKQFITVHDLIHLHDSSESSILKAKYYDLVVKPAILKAKCVFTVSETSAQDIRNWIANDSVSVVVTGCGISKEFNPAGGLDPKAKNKLIYVGSLKPHKNVELIFKLLRLDRRLELIIVTNDREQAAAYALQYGVVQQTVTYTGLSDVQLAALYRNARALLIPSTLEGFGLPAAEALACGTPVVYWEKCRSIKEITAEYGSPVSSHSDAEEWLSKIYSLPKKRTSLLAPDLNWIKQYSWDSVTNKVETELANQTMEVLGR